MTSATPLRALAIALFLSLAAASVAAGPRVLVLYDSSGQYGWLGTLYQQSLVSLLSHYTDPANVTAHAIERYHPGELADYDAGIYLGVVYDNPIPAAFLTDVLRVDHPFCWLGYNLWQLAWNPGVGGNNPAFVTLTGIEYVALDTVWYSEVDYDGVALRRSQWLADLSRVRIADANVATAVATAWTEGRASSAPYIAHGAHFWFVADNPFAVISESDRYLAVVDVLHDILGVDHPTSKTAFLRIEDVSAGCTIANVQAVGDALAAQNVPYTVSLIPEYRDPLGVENGGVPEVGTLWDSPGLVYTLKGMEATGGQMIQHGFTHQYRDIRNPETGMTGDDYEFYRVTRDAQGNAVAEGPLPEDSAQWARMRVFTGQKILQFCGLNPVGWNTPHYVATPTDYPVFREFYRYALDKPLFFGIDSTGRHQFAQLLCPFPLERDIYGLSRIPENIGYVDLFGYGTQPPTLPADILARADTLSSVVRDGTAAFYFHWFYDPALLNQVISGLKDRGYTFIGVPAS